MPPQATRFPFGEVIEICAGAEASRSQWKGPRQEAVADALAETRAH